ncbi:L-lysine decarboxylase [Enterobacter cloacae]|uniref:L-lysine decarboxylase n=1 Tax=Enterobacter cloacae TaxID=550 RepID=A0A377M9A8_ENTCL|nr:L-lysine decarboxylase [Enterobacter cloacae]
MSGERVPDKVFFETQSTHKMLAAFSQASLIHIKGEYDEETFNEAFMMHTTTSPSYPLVASIETAAAMLRGNPVNVLSIALWSARCISAKRFSG